ncbi:MAG: N-acetylmuramoyl-L-alanine amidase [Holosporales bacterium]|jgi:N-acetyl-anhydromuramyl-L-alanine amidase AmpD|nr:N-acetylmuramoyl-L-alanine amidase [Holosporales bacterium]
MENKMRNENFSTIKKILFGLMLAENALCALPSLPIYSIDGLPPDRFVYDHLRNEECQDGVCFRLWEDASSKAPKDWNPALKHTFIMLHYTVAPTYKSTIQTFYERGVSSCYVIDENGNCALVVNPNDFIAFHAGASYFGGFSSLNYFAIGIEHVGPGFGLTYKIVDGFDAPIQAPGDSRFWYPFGPEQVETSGLTIACLQKRHRISSWNVITHADCTFTRAPDNIKSDIGPLYPYRRVAETYGAGFWPSESHQITHELIARMGNLAEPLRSVYHANRVIWLLCAIRKVRRM